MLNVNEQYLHCMLYFPLFTGTESTSKSGKPNTHNVQFLNLAYISNVQLINEAPDAQPPPLPNLNYNKVPLLVLNFYVLLYNITCQMYYCYTLILSFFQILDHCCIFIFRVLCRLSCMLMCNLMLLKNLEDRSVVDSFSCCKKLPSVWDTVFSRGFILIWEAGPHWKF